MRIFAYALLMIASGFVISGLFRFLMCLGEDFDQLVGTIMLVIYLIIALSLGGVSWLILKAFPK